MTKYGYIEYKMPKEMAQNILKTRNKDETNKMKPNEFLCKIVNEQFGLKGYCTKVLLY